jgi:hypothetical protein
MIRRATPEDWPTIVAWRSAHHERMRERNHLPIAPGAALGDAVWLVSADDAPRAAISFFDRPPVRTLFDLYWEPGFAGRRAAYVLAATVLQFANDLDLDVRGDTNISNYEYRALLRRVGFRIYQYDYALDVCYFQRDRGFTSERKFEGDRPNKHESRRLSAAAAANRLTTHNGATG